MPGFVAPLYSSVLVFSHVLGLCELFADALIDFIIIIPPLSGSCSKCCLHLPLRPQPQGKNKNIRNVIMHLMLDCATCICLPGLIDYAFDVHRKLTM
jgi:hypothetical protein